jgi:hypothetical protein
VAHLVTPRPLAGAPTVHSLKGGVCYGFSGEPPPKQPTTAPGHGLTRFGLPYEKRRTSPRLLHPCPSSIPHPLSAIPSLPFPSTHAIITPGHHFPLAATAPEGKQKKDQPRSRRGRPFDPSTGLRTGPSLRPFLSCPGRPGSIDYTRAAFPVKQESGFVFADSSVSVPPAT